MNLNFKTPKCQKATIALTEPVNGADLLRPRHFGDKSFACHLADILMRGMPSYSNQPDQSRFRWPLMSVFRCSNRSFRATGGGWSWPSLRD